MLLNILNIVFASVRFLISSVVTKYCVQLVRKNPKTYQVGPGFFCIGMRYIYFIYHHRYSVVFISTRTGINLWLFGIVYAQQGITIQYKFTFVSNNQKCSQYMKYQQKLSTDITVILPLVQYQQAIIQTFLYISMLGTFIQDKINREIRQTTD